MTIFGKIFKGVGNAAKAVGTGVGNAAKFTVKNPLKVLAPIGLAAGTLFTGGALAPALVTKLAASKVGQTIFGKMVTGVMKSGTVVRNEIVKTLTKNGKSATSKDVDIVEQGLQAEVEKQKGYKLPVDKVSKTAEEARAKLKAIEAELLSRPNSEIRSTIDAERSVLINNPETNGILNRADIPADTWDEMKNAGTVKENVLGVGASLANLFGVSQATQEKAKDVLSIIQGKDTDPYLAEDMQQGVKLIEAKQNEASILPSSIMNFLKMPIVWIVAIGGLVYYFVSKSKK